MARPLSHSPNLLVTTRIVSDVAAGVPKTSAFATNGVAERTAWYWHRRFPEFARAVADAQARFLGQPVTLAGS